MKTAQQPAMTGAELRAIRLALGLGQIRFAEKLGKHHVTISDYERGRHPIPATVAKLAKTFLPTSREISA